MNPTSKASNNFQQDFEKSKNNLTKSGYFLSQDNSEKIKEILNFESSCESFSFNKDEISTINPIPVNITPPRKRCGRKPINTGLSRRKDVVLKSLLRKIRSFYKTRFKEFVQYEHPNQKNALKSHTKNVIKRHTLTSNLRYNISQFIEKEFGMKATEDFILSLKSFIYLNTVNKENQNIFRECLYKFSCLKFDKLIKLYNFKILIFYYYKEVNKASLDKDSLIGLEMIMKK